MSGAASSLHGPSQEHLQLRLNPPFSGQVSNEGQGQTWKERIWNSIPFYSGWNSTPGLSKRTTQTPVNRTEVITAVSKEAIPGWKTVAAESSIELHTGKEGAVRSYYTDFSKQILPKNSRTLLEGEVQIISASYYGARPWMDRIWFSAQDKSSYGLLKVEDDREGAAKFIPMFGIESLVIPIIVPEYSQEGKDGYTCIFETSIALLGVSTWNLDAETPERLFYQGGFESIFFSENKYAIGYKQESKRLECWNLETRQLEYALDGWVQHDEFYLSMGPYDKEKKVLLANSGRYIYAFNLEKKEFLYHLNMDDPSNSIGVYHTVLVGNEYFYCREYSSPTVRVYDILTGEQKNRFDVGGAIDYINSDDFPMTVNDNYIFSLKSGDRKLVCQRDAATDEIIKEFGPAEQIITGLYRTENRLIAACQCTQKDSKNYRAQFIIWDLETGEQLKVITAAPGNYVCVQEVEADKLTLAVFKPSESNSSAEVNEKSKLIQRNYTSDRDEKLGWTNRFPLDVYDSLKLEIWDINACTKMGYIAEEFTETQMPCMASYSKGRLVMDRNKVVILQNFKV